MKKALIDVASNRFLHAAVGVVSQQLDRDRVEGRTDRRNLGEDVDAIAAFVDHPVHAANLALDAIEPLEQPGLVMAARGGSGITAPGSRHLRSPP